MARGGGEGIPSLVNRSSAIVRPPLSESFLLCVSIERWRGCGVARLSLVDNYGTIAVARIDGGVVRERRNSPFALGARGEQFKKWTYRSGGFKFNQPSAIRHSSHRAPPPVVQPSLHQLNQATEPSHPFHLPSSILPPPTTRQAFLGVVGLFKGGAVRWLPNLTLPVIGKA